MMPSEFSKESWNAYYAWSYRHLDLIDRETELAKTCFNAGFYLGAQYATRTTGEMSPHLARFMEFVMWLTDRSEDSTTTSTKTGSSSTGNMEHYQGRHHTELRNDDSVFCLECQGTIAVADG